MTKVDIFSGFLGAGKTTLIKKLISEAYTGEKLVLIENEFGEIGIDGGFMQDAGITVNEMNSGCICCSLVGDFSRAMHQVVEQYAPDRILIEPSGVGKLSDIIGAVSKVPGLEISAAIAVADANRCRSYMKNFGEFYSDQITHAGAIVLSRTGTISEEKLNAALELIRSCNPNAIVVTTPWEQINGKDLLDAVTGTDTLKDELARLEAEAHHHHDDDDEEECCHHHHHHHDDDDDEEECCHHHHDDDDDEEECCHHHHDDDDEEECCHHHHDDDDEEECCHHHHHHHHHGHDADEVFVSWGVETPKAFSEEQIGNILAALEDEASYGIVLRAKGIVAGTDGTWLHFDHVPGEADVRHGSAAVTGRICVIGSALHEEALKTLFGV